MREWYSGCAGAFPCVLIEEHSGSLRGGFESHFPLQIFITGDGMSILRYDWKFPQFDYPSSTLFEKNADMGFGYTCAYFDDNSGAGRFCVQIYVKEDVYCGPILYVSSIYEADKLAGELDDNKTLASKMYWYEYEKMKNELNN